MAAAHVEGCPLTFAVATAAPSRAHARWSRIPSATLGRSVTTTSPSPTPLLCSPRERLWAASCSSDHERARPCCGERRAGAAAAERAERRRACQRVVGADIGALRGTSRRLRYKPRNLGTRISPVVREAGKENWFFRIFSPTRPRFPNAHSPRPCRLLASSAGTPSHPFPLCSPSTSTPFALLLRVAPSAACWGFYIRYSSSDSERVLGCFPRSLGLGSPFFREPLPGVPGTLVRGT